LRAATATPARIIGETNRGRLETGAVADLVLLDQDLEVQATICRGRIVYVAEAARDRVSPELLESL
jgi:N-acetylglucosamine-6-phosphate deacetylase